MRFYLLKLGWGIQVYRKTPFLVTGIYLVDNIFTYISNVKIKTYIWTAPKPEKVTFGELYFVFFRKI